MMFYRKQYFLFIAMICMIAFFIVFKFFVPVDEKEDILFSREPGFYEDPFMLELQSEWETIYYTLDGSVPNKDSIKYETPILIKDATDNENVYSVRTDVSAGFEKEEIEKHSFDYPKYQVPSYKVDKATIVRAVAYDGNGNQSAVKSASYFVGFHNKNGYEEMKTVSVITDPVNLFDFEKGIYVLGKDYNNYEKEYRGTGEWYWREGYWEFWKANYRNRGKNWERKATCQFFDEQGRLCLTQDCGIRIHGGASRAYNPKSLNLYARKEYDGNKRFQEDFFGTGYYADAVTLFQGGSDMRTKAKDYVVSEAIRDLAVSCMHYEPYTLFLDGEYWGIYWLNEKYDADYLQYYYDVKNDNVLLIKEGVLAVGDEDDYKYYSNMVDFCSQSDVTTPQNYEKVCELIDMESYIDYYAIMCYLGRNGDWPEGNYALWRVRKKENGLFGDGKWRWMIFDLNSPCFFVDLDSIQYTMNSDKMFKNLMTNDTFRVELLSRIEELSNTVFEPQVMQEKILRYQIFAAEPMRQNDKRFFGDVSLDDFCKETEELKDFFFQRKKYIEEVLLKKYE